MNGPAVVLGCRDLCREFPDGAQRRRVLDQVSLQVAAGEWVAVTGPSGCGKTTLLTLLAGMTRPDGGVVFTDDGPAHPDHLRRVTSIVFESAGLVPYLNVVENVRLAAAFGTAPSLDPYDLLNRTGAAELAVATPDSLSGGEIQRVALARALARRPKVLLADELTGHLDPTATDQIASLLRELCDSGLAVLTATHDRRLAARADRVFKMRSTVLVA